jgi:hypothetical protein
MGQAIEFENVLVCPVCYALVLCQRSNTSFGHVHLKMHIKAGVIIGYEWEGYGSPIRVYYPDEPLPYLPPEIKAEVKKLKPLPEEKPPRNTYVFCQLCRLKVNVSPSGNFRKHGNTLGRPCLGSNQPAPWREYVRSNSGNTQDGEDLRSRDQGLPGQSVDLRDAGEEGGREESALP